MISLCISNICLKNTPKSEINVSAVAKDIAKHPETVSLQELVDIISEGYTFCPCTFTQPRKKKEFIKQMQLFVLDFDGAAGTHEPCPLKIDDALKRAEKYNLPVVIAYETKSSVDFGRYRLVFKYNEPIYDKRLMEVINRLLLCVFPEADQSTKDLSKMFFPGRNVRYYGEKVFYIDSLAIAAEAIMKNQDSNTWKHRLDSIAKVTGIVTKGKTIYIDFPDVKCNYQPYPVRTFLHVPENPLAKDGDFSVSTLLYNSVQMPKSPKIPCVFFSYNQQICLNKAKVKQNPNYTHVVKFDSFTTESCKLLNEFLSGYRKLEHNEWIGVMSNLIHIAGGQEQFLSTIDKYSDLYDNPDVREKQMRYFINQGYNPYRCESYCPYAEICRHENNMIATLKKNKHSIIKLPREPLYSNISDVRDELYSEIQNAAQKYNTFSVIKTQTGVGKTMAALRFMLTAPRRVIIAFPTIDLMHEIYEQAVNIGIEAMCTSSIYDIYGFLSRSEREEIERYYTYGAVTMPARLLEKFSKTNPHIAEHLKQNKLIQEYSGHIFTTHAKLLTMGSMITPDDIVIIDEDITRQVIQINRITEKDLFSMRDFSYQTEDYGIASKFDDLIYKVKGSNSIDRLPSLDMEYDEQNRLIEKISRRGLTFESCIIGAMEGQSYYYDKYSSSIIFAQRKYLPYAGTYIMLSATANEEICSKTYGNMSFCFHECAKVKYKGKVRLYADKTYSRTCLKNDPELIEKIAEKHTDECFISFMSEMNNIPVPIADKLYYGKALGTNSFAGRDITIIGTPHVPEYVYKLFAAELNHDTASSLAVRKAEYANYEFELMTFDDPFLKEIQSYIISTELEQAVGRARLISNDCTVSLYSSFPVEQAEIAAS